MSGRRLIKKTYIINPSDAGAVIGRKGAGIKSLKDIPNVRNLIFDTKSSPSQYKLIVFASSNEVCDSVFCEVQRRINSKGGVKGIEKIYIDEENTSLTKIALRPVLLGNDVVYRSIQSLFKIDGFEPSDISDAMEGLGIMNQNAGDRGTKETFYEFSKHDFIVSMEEAIQQNRNVDGPLKFTASPGKLAFHCINGSGNKEILRKKLTKDGDQYLKHLNMKPRFSPNLNTKFMEQLQKNLSRNGFKLLNEEAEKFTIVHLFAGEENTFFHVMLADVVDDNLQSTVKDDMRLSQQKKVSVNIIMR